MHNKSVRAIDRSHRDVWKGIRSSLIHNKSLCGLDRSLVLVPGLDNVLSSIAMVVVKLFEGATRIIRRCD